MRNFKCLFDKFVNLLLNSAFVHKNFHPSKLQCNPPQRMVFEWSVRRQSAPLGRTRSIILYVRSSTVNAHFYEFLSKKNIFSLNVFFSLVNCHQICFSSYFFEFICALFCTLSSYTLSVNERIVHGSSQDFRSLKWTLFNKSYLALAIF